MGRPDLNPAVIIDNGTGFTKMGLSGNVEPSYIIPTCVGYGASPAAVRRRGGIEDLDFAIGYDALAGSTPGLNWTAKTEKYSITYPIKHGLVEDWDAMERYWQQCLYSYLRTDPEDHYFVLTEPPLNPPENREETAEIMFETFGVSGLYIGVQAVLALAGSILTEKVTGSNRSFDSLTGTVVDSGDGVTHVIPVADGYVVGSCIKSIPIAGKDITQFVHQLMRERGEKIPPESMMSAAQRVKETNCYVCNDIVKEFTKYDEQPQKYFKQITGETRKTKQKWSADIGYEQFLAPEVFFSPEIAGTGEFFTPLPDIVDTAISQAPIDCRRKLYGNIVLSGGSTLFKDFGRRLQRDITRLVKKRVAKSYDAAGSAAALGSDPNSGQLTAPEVYVASHPTQRFAVWFGGTVVSSSSQFGREVHTKADYDEYGPSICRSNPVSAGLV